MYFVTIAYLNAVHNRTETFAGEIENGENVDYGRAYQFYNELLDEADDKEYIAVYLYQLDEADGELRAHRHWMRNDGPKGEGNPPGFDPDEDYIEGRM